jgi:hypothetical protein
VNHKAEFFAWIPRFARGNSAGPYERLHDLE